MSASIQKKPLPVVSTAEFAKIALNLPSRLQQVFAKSRGIDKQTGDLIIQYQNVRAIFNSMSSDDILDRLYLVKAKVNVLTKRKKNIKDQYELHYWRRQLYISTGYLHMKSSFEEIPDLGQLESSLDFKKYLEGPMLY